MKNRKQLLIERMERVLSELVQIEIELKDINHVTQFDYCTDSRLQITGSILKRAENIDIVASQGIK